MLNLKQAHERCLEHVCCPMYTCVCCLSNMLRVVHTCEMCVPCHSESQATAESFVQLIQIVASAGANPNRAAREFPSLGFTPLHIAANGGSTGLLQQLISQKADVNARGGPALQIGLFVVTVSCLDLHGHSALHLTGLTKTSAPIFKAMALLDGRANMNATDSL